MVTVVTGFNKEGLEQYGYRSLKAFRKHWPKDTKLIVYLEEYEDIKEAYEVRLASSVPQLVEFINKNKNNLVACGKKPRHGWKPKDIEKDYCYKFDILKFCKQVMYMYDSVFREPITDDYVVWMDGDVLAFKDVPSNFIKSLIPEGKAVSYLGRGNKHSEIGLLAFKMPEAMKIIRQYALPIIDNTVFELNEWHSAYLFDEARKKHQDICHDMTPNGRGHVWFQSRLGDYLDHLKGDRKLKGRSKERRG